MNRCQLKGIEGDQVNAILTAAGMNLEKLLKAVSLLPSRLCVSLRNLAGFAFKKSILQPTGSINGCCLKPGFAGSTISEKFGFWKEQGGVHS